MTLYGKLASLSAIQKFLFAVREHATSSVKNRLLNRVSHLACLTMMSKTLRELLFRVSKRRAETGYGAMSEARFGIPILHMVNDGK